jgi:putative transposase
LRYKAPELLATGPNQLWSWDITKLKSPAKWTYFSLYMILDVFSRYVVGWMAAYWESAALAEQVIESVCGREGVEKGQLTIHADRGPSMISKTVALLLSDLEVTKSHGRPNVSNDNPYSESQFKALKYRLEFPDRFGSLQDARSFLIDFFEWYKTMHHHGGLGLLTPYDVHFGLPAKRHAEREVVMVKAFKTMPERFVRGVPIPLALPAEVWINISKAGDGSTDELHIKF